MLINLVSIKNFRCIRELTVEFDDLTAFVGRNGSGKSTILHALDVFYNIKAPVSEDDFFNRNTSAQIEITVEYRSLGSDEQTEFAAFISNGMFAVTKRLSLHEGRSDQRYYAATRQIPELSRIRNLKGVTEKRNAWNELVEKGELPGIGPKSIRGDNPDDLVDAYEPAHPELTEWISQEVQFLGPPNIGGGKLDNYTKFVYIPAVRDASADSLDKKGSSLFQLLDFMVMRRFRARQDLLDLQEEFAKRLRDLYAPAKLTEFNELASDISRTLQIYVPNAQLELRVVEPGLPTIPGPATIAELTEDEFAGSIERKGHGLQRALIFALLQHLAVAQPVEPKESPEEDTDNEGELQTNRLSEETVTDTEVTDSPHGSTGPDLILAIEEPELYQHPLRARYLAGILLNMSRERSIGPGGRNQVVYTTHSPYFVDLGRFGQLRIMHKYKTGDDGPPCTAATSYSLYCAAKEMAVLTGKPEEEFTADSFRVRASPVMTHLVNEGFFADAVVLVEGDTEAAAIQAVAGFLDNDWLSKGVAVIPVGGKTKIDRAAIVFKGLGIPTYYVFDADSRHKGTKNESKEASTNRLLLRLGGSVEGDFPKDTVIGTYCCFEDDFEGYCKQVLGAAEYDKFRLTAAITHGYDKPSDAIKNYDVVFDMITTIYKAGSRLPALDGIVKHVNALLVRGPIGDTGEIELGDSSST